MMSLKYALTDKAKVSLKPEDGNSLFQILDNGLQISTGLTVLLGKRSSGKTYTLDMQMQSALEICRLAAAKPQQYTVSPDGTWKRNS